MATDARRRAGSHHLSWGGLRTSRTLIPEIVLYTPSGQERIVEIPTKRDLLRLMEAGFECLRQIEEAEAIRQARMEGERRAREVATDPTGADQ